MSTTVDQVINFNLGGKDVGAGKAIDDQRAKLEFLAKNAETVGERVKAALKLKRLEGENAVDKILGGKGEGALDLILGLGPGVAIAGFAMRMLGDASAGAAEHLKKVKDGSEGVTEGLLKAAAAVPVFGEAVKAGMGVAGLLRGIFGHEDPEEELKRATEADKKIAERLKMLQEGRARDRLIGLRGDAKDRAEVENEFTDKVTANQAARRDAILAEQKETAAAINRLRSEVNFSPGADKERDRQIRDLENGRQSRIKQAARPFSDEDVRLAKEKAARLKEIDEAQGREVTEIVRVSAMGAAKLRREIAERGLTEAAQSYLAKALRIEAEYQQGFAEIAKRAADARRQHNSPGDASRINAAASDEERAALEKRNADLSQALDDSTRDRKEKLRKEGQETVDIRQATSVKLLNQGRQQLAAEISQIRYDAQARRDEVDREAEKEAQHKDHFEQLRIQQAASARKQAITEGARADEAAAQKSDRDRQLGIGDRRFEIDKQLRNERLEALKEEASQGVAGADLEAKKLEIAEKYRDKRQEIAKLLRDENITVGERIAAFGAAAGLVGRESAEAKRLAGGGSAPTGFGLESGRSLTGVESRASGPIVKVADNAETIAKNTECLLTLAADLGKVLAPLLSLSPYNGK